MPNLLKNGIDIHWFPNGCLPCERLIFREPFRTNPGDGTRLQSRGEPLRLQAWRVRPNTHTYRLLIVKDRRPRTLCSAAPLHRTDPRSAEKRDYDCLFGACQTGLPFLLPGPPLRFPEPTSVRFPPGEPTTIAETPGLVKGPAGEPTCPSPLVPSRFPLPEPSPVGAPWGARDSSSPQPSVQVRQRLPGSGDRTVRERPRAAGERGGAARERLSYDRPPGRSREALEKRAKHAVPPPASLPALESRARAGATAEAAAPARLPGAMGAAVDRRARAPRPSPSDQRCRKSGLRFSTKAAIPSFWSSVANSEWNSRRSKSRPSLSGDS